MIIFFDSGHGGVSTASDGAGLPLEVGTRGVGLEKLGPILIDTSDEEGDAEWPRHRLSFASFVALAEVHGHIGDSLSDQIDWELLDVVEGMVRWFNSGVIYENSGIANDTGHGASTMSVDFNQFLWLRWLHQLGGHLFLYAEDDALVSFDSDRGASMLDRKKIKLVSCL